MLIKHLCVVTPYAPNSKGYGGIARSARAYLDGFRRLDIPVDYISSTASMIGTATPDDLEQAFPGTRAFYYRASISKRWGVGIGFFLLLPIIFRSQAVILHGTRTMPTVVAGILCRACHKPYAVVAHAQLDASRVARTQAKHHRLFALTEGAVMWSVKGARTLVLSGVAEQRALLPELVGMPFHVIENFFDFDLDAIRTSHLETSKIYLYAGRVESDKGVLAFIRVWRTVASTSSRLQIIGDGNGPYAALVRAEATADARISYFGEVPQERVYELMRQCSVVVLPTGMDDLVTENFGNVIVEGFIAGKPAMVATGLHWDAYAAEPAVIRFKATSDCAAACIREFEGVDAAAYDAMSASAIKLASLFHITKVLPRIREILDEMIRP